MAVVNLPCGSGIGGGAGGPVSAADRAASARRTVSSLPLGRDRLNTRFWRKRWLSWHCAEHDTFYVVLRTCRFVCRVARGRSNQDRALWRRGDLLRDCVRSSSQYGDRGAGECREPKAFEREQVNFAA